MSAEGVTIKASAPKLGRTVEFVRNFGGNLEELVSNMGAETVYNMALQQTVIRCQAAVRSALEAHVDAKDPDSALRYTDDEAIAIGQEYMPGAQRRDTGVTRQKAADTVAAAIAKGTLTLEELEARIAALRAEQGADEE